MRAPSALYSRQRYAARPSLLCRLPLVLLQDAAVARIAGEHDVVAAVENGDVERVRDHVIADPACVHETYSLWCDARPLHMLLQTKAGLRSCFERCNSCLLFSGKTVLHLSSMSGRVEVCKLLVESQADVNAKDGRCDARPLHMLLQTKAVLRSCCNSRLLFSGKTALHLSSQDGHNDMEVCKLLVECQADVNVKDIYQCDARL